MRVSRLTRATGALLLPVAVLLAVLAGCTNGDEPTAAPSPSASTEPSGTTATHAPPPPPAPKDEACYRLNLDELTQPTNSSKPVDCSGRHDAQTVHVGRLDTVVDGHAVAVDSAAVQRQLESVCPRRLADYLGGSSQAMDLSRFHIVWFSPTLAQSDKGADWFRCDVIAFGKGDVLFPLPPPSKLRGVLGRDGSLSTYGLCGTAAPGARGFERVICAQKHSWQAFTTIGLSGGKRYPGVGAVRDGGDASCKDAARERSGNALKYEYGWEWPSRAQWARGQHYGYCWAPD